MKALSAAVLTVFFVLVINGCTGQKMMEPADSEMSSMDKPMDKNMKEQPMMEDAADPMQPKMEPMGKTMP